jgi:hypothetical protein
MKTLLLVMAIGRGVDVVTSLAAFHHDATERNPLVVSSQPVAFVSQMAIETAGQAYLIHQLNRHSHPKLAKAIAFVQIGASSGATIGNVLVIRRQFQLGR